MWRQSQAYFELCLPLLSLESKVSCLATYLLCLLRSPQRLERVPFIAPGHPEARRIGNCLLVGFQRLRIAFQLQQRPPFFSHKLAWLASCFSARSKRASATP